jgi:hypothetical protein
MAKKYIVFQDIDGQIKVRRRTLVGLKLKVRDHSGSALGPFSTQKSAEDAIRRVEERKRDDARAKRSAIEASGVAYVFDCSKDEDLTIKNKFRIMRTDKVEDKPFYLQELTTRGWITVCEKFEKLVFPKAKRFSSESSAKTELLAIVQKMQEDADRKRKARVLTVIDSKVYDLTEEDQLAGAA